MNKISTITALNCVCRKCVEVTNENLYFDVKVVRQCTYEYNRNELHTDIWTDGHPNKDSDAVPITGYKIKPVSTKSNIIAFSISF